MSAMKAVNETMTVLLGVVLLFGIAACGAIDADSMSRPVATTAQAEAPTSADGDDDLALCVPVPGAATVRIAAFQDKSRSTGWTRTAQMTEDDVLSLIAIVCRGGGSIAIGLISDDSNRPLARFSIGGPPAAPRMDEVSNDPFEGPEARERNRIRREGHHAEVRRWQSQAETRIGQFLDDLLRVLDQPADALRTDVAMALARANIYFAEPAAASSNGGAVHNYCLLVTDGQDTARRQGAPSDIQARLMLVNGAGHQGMLAAYNPTRFEAVTAAIDYIRDSETAAHVKD